MEKGLLIRELAQQLGANEATVINLKRGETCQQADLKDYGPDSKWLQFSTYSGGVIKPRRMNMAYRSKGKQEDLLGVKHTQAILLPL